MELQEELTLEELKTGYIQDREKDAFVCLECGKSFDVQEIFCIEGRFFPASRAVALHLESAHGARLEALLSRESKYLSFTSRQQEMLSLFAAGLSDGEVGKRLGITASTVRHQRFIFREKRKAARMTLAVLELAAEGAEKNKSAKSAGEALIPIHGGATMIDERFEITEEEEKKILSTVFTSLSPLKLKVFSAKEKKKVVIIRRIAREFQPGIRYTEPEVNNILAEIYPDFATIRRYLVEYGWLCRERDCSAYWLNEK